MDISAKTTLQASMLPIVAVSGAAFAQEAAPVPGEIVVTAQRRGEDIQSVPVTVTAYSGEALQERGLTEIGDLVSATPGLQVGKASGIVQPFLRGVGAGTTAMGSEASVAVYADGVYFARLPIGFFSLANVERVEVIKGPQGTLFGRNSSGGVIQIVTPDPSHMPMMKGSIGIGRFDTVEGNLYATTGLSDKLAADISISGRTVKDGWGTNVVTGNRAAYQDSFTARGKLLFEPSEQTRLMLTGFYTYNKNSVQGNAYPGTTQGFLSQPFGINERVDFYDVRTNLDSYVDAEAWGTSLRVEHETSFAKLTSITAYMKDNEFQYFDADYSPRDDFNAIYPITAKQFTQEFQISSLADSHITWIAGAYYFNFISEYPRISFTSPSGGVAAYAAGIEGYSRQKAQSWAGYGQAAYEVVPNLSLTGGLRYTYDKTKADGFLINATTGSTISDPPENSFTTKKVTFKAGVDYKLDDALLYASFSRGYKSGAFNILTYNPNPAKPEIIDAYELGFKATLFQRLLRLSAAAFYYDITSPQVQLLQGINVLFSNAGASRSQGVEFNADAAVSDRLNLRAGVSYVDSKYTDYTNAPSGPPNPNSPYGAVSPLIQVDASGNRTPQAPKWMANVGFDYRLDSGVGEWLFTLDYMYNDGWFWEPDNLLVQDGFHMINGQIKFSPTDNLALRVWGRNLAGEKIAGRGVTTGGPPGYVHIPEAPRTYGIALDFQF